MKKFYITTAIDYVNAEPHIGHAYQKVIADVLSRWHKLKGEDVFFLTGTDEHGQKIARSAEDSNLKPKEFVDKLVKKFEESWKLLNIDYSKFIRTTDDKHKKLVQEFITKIQKDIYKGIYEGLYCVGCEAYITEKELVNGKCPFHPNKEPESIKEETYFFKLSKYQDKLLELYKNNPNYILPRKRAKEIINRVKEGLKDLSITRTNFSWGIPYPQDKQHVIYVWFDALLNYITALDWPRANFKKYWPADVELLGVDNSWFHCVIWPAMLFSAGIEPAKSIFVHGFLTFNNQKISKSLGNSISPRHLAEKYGSDSVRYFICRNFVFGEDGDFSEDVLKDRINNELANDLGNLVSRVLTLAEKNFKSVNKNTIEKSLSSKLDINKIDELILDYKINEALNEIWKFINECNKHINQEKLWELKGNSLEKNLYSLLESIRIITILLEPFIPETSDKILKQLNVSYKNLKDAKFGLIKEYKVKKGEILFKKIK